MKTSCCSSISEWVCVCFKLFSLNLSILQLFSYVKIFSWPSLRFSSILVCFWREFLCKFGDGRKFRDSCFIFLGFVANSQHLLGLIAYTSLLDLCLFTVLRCNFLIKKNPLIAYMISKTGLSLLLSSSQWTKGRIYECCYFWVWGVSSLSMIMKSPFSIRAPNGIWSLDPTILSKHDI